MRYEKNSLYKDGKKFIFDIGDTAAVKVDELYGIMQFIGIREARGHKYYISKIFTDLVNYLPNKKELITILKSDNYYLSCSGLYASDFIGNPHGFCVTYLGVNEIYGKKELPYIWRSYDTNPYLGKFNWYLRDIENNVCKTVKKCDEQFKKLSPYACWGLLTIVNNWRNHFTLDTWDDEFLRKNLEIIYERCPEFRPRKVEYETVKNAYPPHKWVKETPLEEEKDESIRKGYQAILETLKEYITAIDALEKKTAGELRKLTKNVVKRLNEIDKEYECIETVEREDLWEYFVNVLWSLKKPTVIDVIDEVREW